MTLMPVSNISTAVDWSSYRGGGRWIDQRSFALIGPRSSIGSPMTFMIRPSVSLPTGTVMAAPVSVAFMPRTMPSVGFIEMQRTRFSPRCCATSVTTLIGCPSPCPSSSTMTAL